MSDQGSDLSDGESTVNPKALKRYLGREIWRHQWERGLAILALCVSLFFYTVLIGFIFLGHFRFVSGPGYWIFSSKPHVVTDVPIIIALSTIPTILLIALLRYFHHRDKPSDDSESLVPPSLQVAKEVMGFVNKG